MYFNNEEKHKRFRKITDFKKSIGSYRFENDSLFIYLKTSQGSIRTALKADTLMKLVDKKRKFHITRERFLDKN